MCRNCIMTADRFAEDTRQMSFQIKVEMAKLLLDSSLSQGQRIEVLTALTPYIVNLIDDTIKRTADATVEMSKHVMGRSTDLPQ